jgi:Uma2 family endonuclease
MTPPPARAGTAWTADELSRRFGAITLDRVRTDPEPGSATEADLLAIYHREKRLYELIDGLLLEKCMGVYESYLGLMIANFLNNFLSRKKPRPGFVLGADGMVRLRSSLVRIPDGSYVSFARLPDRKVPRVGIGNFAPDLAVEVISEGNTTKEMATKLEDYFRAGVLLVWFCYPKTCEVHVFSNLTAPTVLGLNDVLDGGQVLPGFTLPLRELFAEPGEEN